jgi:hypothetical protein
MMKQFLQAASAPAAALIAALAFGDIITPQASAGDFCRRDVTGHMTGCGFDSIAQCQATAAGIGGDCFRDPSKNDSGNAFANQQHSSSNAFAYQPKASRRRGGSPHSGTSANSAE